MTIAAGDPDFGAPDVAFEEHQPTNRK